MKPVFAYYFGIALTGFLITSVTACSQTTKAIKSGNIPAAPVNKDVGAPQKEVYKKEPARLQFPKEEMPIKVEVAPVVADVKVDTTPAKPKLGMPVLSFDAKEVHFGNIKTGDKPSFTYNITNTGDTDMDIELVSGCDCTDIDWTKTTIKPGGKGFVKITYNSNRAEPEDHKKKLVKDVTVILKQSYPQNGYPIVDVLKFDTFIID
ncbi:MAG: hypothetical protein RIS64_913 [Bacteroidota bacterium]|jgi:hypothetical protein